MSSSVAPKSQATAQRRTERVPRAAQYPVTGWWKESPRRDKSERGARYALVVSIEADRLDVDVWTPIANQIGVQIPV
jgi:hypothetical protein